MTAPARTFAELVSMPPPEAIALLASHRDEHPSDLLTLILDFNKAGDDYNAYPSTGPENGRLEAALSSAYNALAGVVIERGEDCTTLAEARAAARLATEAYRNHNDQMGAALALSALAYFLGSEAVSFGPEAVS